jgi:heat-inducible transcriptional repressor
VDEWMRVAAVILSRTAQTAALITRPRAAESQFKHLELISTQGRMVLLVLVLHGGHVHQQVLTLTDPVSQEMLSYTAQLINNACGSLNADQVRNKTRAMSDALSREVGDLVVDAMRQTDQQSSRDVYRFGLSENLPTFSDNEAQQAIHVLEEQSALDNILREMVLLDNQPDVRVVVAGEGRWDDLSHLSMVLGRYGTSQARGTLGVLGPTRMRYGRAISAVRYIAGLMSDLLDDVYSSDQEAAEGSGDKEP